MLRKSWIGPEFLFQLNILLRSQFFMSGKKKIDTWNIWKGRTSYNYEVAAKKSENIRANAEISFFRKTNRKFTTLLNKYKVFRPLEEADKSARCTHGKGEASINQARGEPNGWDARGGNNTSSFSKFFLGEALNQTLGRFCTVCGAVFVEERSKFPYYKQYDISTQQFNGELFGKRLKLNFLAFDRLALWLNLIWNSFINCRHDIFAIFFSVDVRHNPKRVKSGFILP